LLVAFEIGQLLNQLSWHLERYTCFVGEYEGPLRTILSKLTEMLLVVASTIEAGVQLRDAAVECLHSWKAIHECEAFAEAVQEAIGSLKDHAAEAMATDISLADAKAALKPIVEWTAPYHKRIRDLLQHDLKPFPEMWTAVLLGEYLDQGLRPPGVLSYMALVEPNPQRLAWKRMDRSVRHRLVRRDRSVRHPKDPCQIPVGVRDGWSPFQKPVRKVKLPPRYKFGWRWLYPGDLPPPPGWAETISGLWQRLRIPTRLPGCLFLLFGRPQLLGLRGTVKRVEQAARDGLTRLSAGSLELQAGQHTHQEGRDLHSTCVGSSETLPPDEREDQEAAPSSGEQEKKASRWRFEQCAVGIDGARKWQRFTRHGSEWRHRGPLKGLRKGLREKLLRAFAEYGGGLGRADALKTAAGGPFHPTDASKLMKKIKPEMSELREILRAAFGVTDKADPLPWEDKAEAWHARIHIGFATKDDQGRLTFRTMEELSREEALDS
jgi:hypothetical protein